MLVLTRREAESIMLGHEIEITVLEIRGHQVRIGIECPQHISIARGELYRAQYDPRFQEGKQDGSGA